MRVMHAPSLISTIRLPPRTVKNPRSTVRPKLSRLQQTNGNPNWQERFFFIFSSTLFNSKAARKTFAFGLRFTASQSEEYPLYEVNLLKYIASIERRRGVVVGAMPSFLQFGKRVGDALELRLKRSLGRALN